MFFCPCTTKKKSTSVYVTLFLSGVKEGRGRNAYRLLMGKPEEKDH
jgi:hypothetical protein